MAEPANAPGGAASPAAVHWLTVLPGGWRLPVQAGQSLLQAAQQAGVRLPRACRNGSCRACIAQLHSGRVHHSIAWPGLLAEELAAGAVLPCVACADSDLVLMAPEASGPRAAEPAARSDDPC